jgi:hypothetical protein
MDGDWSRRDLLTLAVAAVSLSTTSGRASADADSGTLYLDQSGGPWKPPLCLGALVVGNSDQHRTAIERIRDETGYRRVLEYRTTDRRKLPYCEKLFDYVLDAEDIRFAAATLTAGEPTAKDRRPRVMSARVHDLLEAGHLAPAPTWTVVMQSRSERSVEDQLSRTLKQVLPKSDALQTSKAAADPLLQLAGLLTGCVRAEIAGTKCPTKLQILDLLRKRLGTASLLNASLPEKFAVLQLKS